MNTVSGQMRLALLAALFFVTAGERTQAGETVGKYTISPGHPSLAEWLLPEEPPHPENNRPNAKRITLGQMLFFDPRLSRDGNMSCATCHNPSLGWSDGQATARGMESMALERATPTIVNTAFNTIQMWDGREKTLESQAMGPLEAEFEMGINTDMLFAWLNANKDYRLAFEAAYPGEGVNRDTYSRAIASFERTIVSKDSPFDRWVSGDKSAMTDQQVRGFALFVDADKGNCVTCHSAPNFTDNGFHNLGLQSFAAEHPDMGRYAQKPIGLMKGAFKTPTLRDVARTRPYFHDGSAADLMEVMDHYVSGGVVKANVSPNLKSLQLSQQEKQDLVAFMGALSSPAITVSLPILPDGTVDEVEQEWLKGQHSRVISKE